MLRSSRCCGSADGGIAILEEPLKPEILVIERHASIAHPSHANGGYMLLHPGAVAYRNADFVARNPNEILSWCRDYGCDVAPLSDLERSTVRHRVRFPDAETFGSFKLHFK
jgi:hypothetical protein